MPQIIDLRCCKLKIRPGPELPHQSSDPTVLSAAASIGDTVLNVDDVPIRADATAFIVDKENNPYRITSTGTGTININPGLMINCDTYDVFSIYVAAEDDLGDAILPIAIEPKDGNLTWSFTKDYEYITKNGRIVSRKKGEQSPLTGTVTLLFDDNLNDDATAEDNPLNFLYGAFGSFNFNNPCGPPTSMIEMFNQDDSKILIINQIAINSEDVDIKESSVSFSFESVMQRPPRWI